MFASVLNFQKIYEDKINITLNHIFVIYAFFLPISVDGYSRSFLFSLMLVLVAIRGNYTHYFKYSINHPIVIVFVIYASMHYLWLIGTDNMQWAERMLDQAKVAFYPILFFSFLDKRFALPIVSGFLFGMLFSELVSYAIHFKLIPWQFIINDILYPWKSHPVNIAFYSAHSPMDPSPFLHHSFYAAALALSAAILIYKVLNKTLSKPIHIISIILISTMTLNILITGGRTGYFLYVILLMTILIINYRKKIMKPLIISALSVSIIFMIAYSSNGLFTERINQTVKTIKSLYVNKKDFNSSFGYRLGIWYYGLAVIKDSPFLGTGTGDQMDALHTKIKDEHRFLKSMPDMHNHYFSIFLQFGLVGLSILLNLYFKIFKFDTEDKELNAIKLLIFITMLITALTSTYWHFYLPLYVVLLSAITVKNTTIKNDIKKPSIPLYLGYIALILTSTLVEKLQ